ncbi:hypothetical protein BDM02DRAFT_3118010 [Thelephora ganbajun]|uniref:Uncharacterized protein n=1 Tax=Thelephora ganbajun TaxID=370292 RepID=A0ACB6ZB53_THEGA|nr:hypothetical protein BDM02DRAFT_3118010 [Thelephora ganbajun]
MAGRKRAAPEDPTTTRPAKTTRTGTGKAKGKTGPKTNLSTRTFKSQAHPLHINITHTPPPVVEDLGEKAPAEPMDPGFLAALSLQPSSFSTGTYGWKGSKRVTIEVDNPDTGEKEKLQVQLSFNATVLGSKGKDGEGEEAKEEEEKKEKDEEKDQEKGDKEDVQEE